MSRFGTGMSQPLGVLEELLRNAQAHSRERWGQVMDVSPLSGGSINRVYRVDLSGGRKLVFKWHPSPPQGFFEAEREGLEALRVHGPLRVPAVYAAGSHGIVMEWLPPAVGEHHRQAEALGVGLAQQHRATAPLYGWEKDNFIGLLPQTNRQSRRWVDFFRDGRLRPQLELAEKKGRLTPQRRRWAEKVLERLEEWIDEEALSPSLLHGDLWGGNWMATVHGPALIDPAVGYGDREMDLAMAQLFGGFPPAFFEAYREAYPLRAGYEERRPLYQLYYLLIHLNLFGESYGPPVDRILRRYGQ